MPFSSRICLLASALLSTATACHHLTPSPCHCRGAGAEVRTLTGVPATVGVERQSHHYVLLVPRSTAGSPVEMGILCDSLPGDLSQAGKRVVVSGTYYAKPGNPTPDTVQYYLSYSQVVAQ